MKPLILNAAESGASGSQTTGGYGSDSTAALLLERAQRNHSDPGLTLGGVLAAVAASHSNIRRALCICQDEMNPGPLITW